MDWYDGLTIGKDPDSVLDYRFDWSTWLGADTINSYVVTAATGLTIDSHSQTGAFIDVWLSGGTVDMTYLLTCEITTAAGRTALRKVTMDCGLPPGEFDIRACG